MNKPVAWINIEDGNSILDWEKDEYAQKHYPLYTHLVKELTDEEIIELFADTRFDSEERVKFARAILRKAQEK